MIQSRTAKIHVKTTAKIFVVNLYIHTVHYLGFLCIKLIYNFILDILIHNIL